MPQSGRRKKAVSWVVLYGTISSSIVSIHDWRLSREVVVV
jgi:hypothetical protein